MSPPGDVFAFGPFALDVQARRLTRDGAPVSLTGRQFDLLHLFVTHAGDVLSKDTLIAAAWPDVAVTDNSLEQAISSLRRTLSPPSDQSYIQTQARRGYRFSADVVRLEHRETDESLEALLAPHRAWVDGRSALETLERSEILRARQVFSDVLAQVPGQAAAHVGLANACAMQFEMTRADAVPDAASLAEALHHAREACRLDAQYAEAWATLGFVLARTGPHVDALAASRRAVLLEPDNWRHHLRLGYTSWGEERLREARRSLALLPGFPLAHWLIATVYVARQALHEAERELRAGLEAQGSHAASRFSSVALHWLLGLVLLSTGRTDEARTEFDAELAQEGSGQLYSRECCANTWYALGALARRTGRAADADAAFQEALRRMPQHALATAARMTPDSLRSVLGRREMSPMAAVSVDHAIAQAVLAMTASGGQDLDHARATLERALSGAPEGSAGWLLPLEPTLQITARPEPWAAVLSRLRNRAA